MFIVYVSVKCGLWERFTFATIHKSEWLIFHSNESQSIYQTPTIDYNNYNDVDYDMVLYIIIPSYFGSEPSHRQPPPLRTVCVCVWLCVSTWGQHKLMMFRTEFAQLAAYNESHRKGLTELYSIYLTATVCKSSGTHTRMCWSDSALHSHTIKFLAHSNRAASITSPIWNRRRLDVDRCKWPE